MANRHCGGLILRAKGTGELYWRCLMDGRLVGVMPTIFIAIKDKEACPCCLREMNPWNDGKVIECEVVVQRLIKIPWPDADSGHFIEEKID